MKFIDEAIESYCIQKSSKPSAVCEEIATYTRANIPQSQMLIGPMEASVLGSYIRAIRAKRILEFGTYTGYSALAMAENLPDDGELVSLDVNEETSKLARSFWDKSPDGKKIKNIVAPALESLKTLNGKFDFVFIDADKENYLAYLKASLERLSEGGMIALDNCLRNGKSIEEGFTDPGTEAIKECNLWIAQQSTLFSSLLPVRDGIFVVQRR